MARHESPARVGRERGGLNALFGLTPCCSGCTKVVQRAGVRDRVIVIGVVIECGDDRLGFGRGEFSWVRASNSPASKCKKVRAP